MSTNDAIKSIKNCPQWQVSGRNHVNPLRAKPTKWSNALKQLVSSLPANNLIVFDHFVGFGALRVKFKYDTRQLLSNFETRFIFLAKVTETEMKSGVADKKKNLYMIMILLRLKNCIQVDLAKSTSFYINRYNFLLSIWAYDVIIKANFWIFLKMRVIANGKM